MNEQEELKEKFIEGVKQEHAQWLTQQTTLRVLAALRKRKERYVKQLAIDSTDVKITDAQIRYHTIAIKDFELIENLLTNPELILSTLNTNSTNETK